MGLKNEVGLNHSCKCPAQCLAHNKPLVTGLLYIYIEREIHARAHTHTHFTEIICFLKRGVAMCIFGISALLCTGCGALDRCLNFSEP